MDEVDGKKETNRKIIGHCFEKNQDKYFISRERILEGGMKGQTRNRRFCQA